MGREILGASFLKGQDSCLSCVHVTFLADSQKVAKVGLTPCFGRLVDPDAVV